MLGKFERIFHPFLENEPSSLPTGVFAFIWACTQGVRGMIAIMALLAMTISIFDAMVIALLGRIIDCLNTQLPSCELFGQQDFLLRVAIVMVFSVVLVLFQTLIKHQTLAVNLPMRLRWNFHRLMLGQPISFYCDDFSGRLATTVMQTSVAVREAIFVITDVLVTVGVYAAAVVVLAAVFDIKLIWPFLVWFLLYIVALRYFVPRLGKASQVQAGARALLTGRVADAYTNIATVKLFSHARHEAEYAREAMQAYRNTGYAEMRLISVFEIVNHGLSIGLTIGTLGTALWLWSLGEVGAGAVAAASAMALRLQGMSHWFMWEMTSLLENVGAVRDGMKIVSLPPAVVDVPEAFDLRATEGEICFQGVSFRYIEHGRPVIDDLNLAIQAGEKVGLVGRSGAGKSTLLNLLLRFHDLQQGCISIDGQNVAHVTQQSLRSQIGVVSQEVSLLHRSVAENISYGSPDASYEKIVAAARRAEAHDFISELSDAKKRYGYEAHVGDRGLKLSGGQRQRIAIARVALKNAPILLLDEATSALDSEVELAIQQNLDHLMEGKTVIAVAHRLSTLLAMDRLIVLDQGRIVEQGNHSTLLAQGGLYATLWSHQGGVYFDKHA